MRNYWTCTKFADWLRGTSKLGAATGKEWHEWEETARAKHPFRYWLAEEGLDRLQDIWCWIPDRINDIRYYINNRWVTQTHTLKAHPRDIPRGSWRDVGNRFLPCLMNELVDFIEIEQAWVYCVWDDDARKKYNYPWWRRWYRQWRCPEAGIAYLKWASNLTNKDFIEEGEEEVPTYQAIAAKEMLELYTWWKEVYPKRPDPYDASGWSAYCDMRRERGYHLLDMEDRTEEESAMRDTALAKSNEIEKAYNDEDEAMMIRLIKIRESLWT
jgi:hypothetical protein